jgi:hypothetical protein
LAFCDAFVRLSTYISYEKINKKILNFYHEKN